MAGYQAKLSMRIPSRKPKNSFKVACRAAIHLRNSWICGLRITLLEGCCPLQEQFSLYGRLLVDAGMVKWKFNVLCFYAGNVHSFEFISGVSSPFRWR